MFVALERILAYDGPEVANNSGRGRRLVRGLHEFKIGLCAAQTADLFLGRDGETEPEGPAKERTCLRVFFAVVEAGCFFFWPAMTRAPMTAGGVKPRRSGSPRAGSPRTGSAIESLPIDGI